MSLGNNLFHARKKNGMSQETVAEKLGISRQKWIFHFMQKSWNLCFVIWKRSTDTMN